MTSTDQKAFIYPIAFFWRRLMFAFITVYLFDWPQMQMIAHHVLTVLYIGVLVYNPHTYDSVSQKIIEVGSEATMHFTSIFLSQFNVASFTAHD